jgi:type VI secretion system protein ImpL
MRIDQRYESQSPYAANVSNFERWTGDNTPTRAGFEAHGPEEVAQYLAFQRQQVQQYAAKATPLVKFLDGRIPGGGKEPGRSLLKWQRIVADLQKATAKIPGTSLAALEDFIGADMDKVSPENCQTASLTTASLPGGDYFVQTRESLRRGLLNRCRVLSEQNSLRAYTRLAKLFNERLSGKFPFSTPPPEQMPNEADPQDIAELFRLLDTYGKPIHAGLRSGTFGSSYASVQSFMNQLEGLRPLFTPLLAAESDPVPIFDFVPVFRVNQGREVNGNQIIEWTLQVGTDTFHYHDPQRAGRWSYGEPVKLTLRWAKDSPQQPLLGSAVADSKAGSRTVTFEYHDNWALFRMLKLHEPPSNDFDRMADPDPQTLVFTVNDNKSSDPAARSTGNTSTQAKVFVRIKLRPPGKPDNLRVRVFPVEAPALEQVQAQGQSNSAGGDNQ